MISKLLYFNILSQKMTITSKKLLINVLYLTKEVKFEIFCLVDTFHGRLSLFIAWL